LELTNIDSVISLLKKHGLYTKKHLGQNFLIDEEVLKEIVKTAKIEKSDHVVEIGPGLGVLTNELAKNAKKITSVEIDGGLLPLLSETLKEHSNIEIINQDALTFIPPKTPYKLTANIPYYITSPLINHFLQSDNPPETITILIQKEVAEKACKIEPKMSILSLQIALFGKAELIKKIPPEAFFPAPKVESAIFNIIPNKKSDSNYIEKDEALEILKLAKQAFSQKRKKLSNTILRDIENSPIDPSLRPQALSVKEWQKLNNFLNSQ